MLANALFTAAVGERGRCEGDRLQAHACKQVVQACLQASRTAAACLSTASSVHHQIRSDQIGCVMCVHVPCPSAALAHTTPGRRAGAAPQAAPLHSGTSACRCCRTHPLPPRLECALAEGRCPPPPSGRAPLIFRALSLHGGCRSPAGGAVPAARPPPPGVVCILRAHRTALKSNTNRHSSFCCYQCSWT